MDGQRTNQMDLKTLSVEEILRIHEILVENFLDTNDPISPAGVRSNQLLESAVSRQWTGLGEVLKYPAPIQNASTLLYGICGDHPFHNGNKRTALVAMLAHLDKNKLRLYHTTQKELYDFMLKIASHMLGEHRDKRRRKSPRRRSSDEEVMAIISWLSKRVEKVTRGEKEISYRDLKTILQRFGYFFNNPKNNSIDIVKLEMRTKGLIRKKEIETHKRIGNIPYPGEHRSVSVKDIKNVRRICRLREEDGVDSDAFYDDTAVLHGFVNIYRKVLRYLART